MRQAAEAKIVAEMPAQDQLRMRRFFDLTSHLNVYEIKTKSDEIRERMEEEGKDTEGLIYGEVSYFAIYELIAMLKSKGYVQGQQHSFLDLGSGVGKAMVMAAFIHQFEACYGFEVIQELHQMALELFEKCREDVGPTRLESIQDNYMTASWPAATIILSNSTCLTRTAFEELLQKADLMPPGTIFISMSKAVHRDGWTLVEQSQKILHWGMCSFHVYVRDPANFSS